ncbi:MAG: MerR family transcriptional regulator [Enterococcus sp.]
MDYLSIGKISKLSNLSIRTLRYYDQIDLFKPEYIDATNNYRYYSVQQLFYLQMIKYLRKMNLPIDEIKDALSLSPEQLSDFLEEQAKQIQLQINELLKIEEIIKNQRVELNNQTRLLNKSEKQIYTRRIEKRSIVKQLCKQEVTPLTQPDIYFANIYSLIEENNLTPKSYQYNCAYPLRKYGSIEEIKYSYLFATIYLTESEATPTIPIIDEIAGGNYLCITFDWNTENYMDNYFLLTQAYKDLGYTEEPIVYEISMANHLNSSMDASFVTELQIKI